MSTQTLTRSGTLLPQVNLLPPEIFERRRMRRYQYGMAAAVVAAAGVVGVVYESGQSAVTTARTQLAAAQAQQQHLSHQRASYASVTAVEGQLDATRAMAVQALGQEVHWSNYLNALSTSTPKSVWVTNLSIAQNSATTSGAPAGAAVPAAPGGAGIATVTFGGVALTHNNVADWLDALGKVRGYSNASFSTSAESLLNGHTVVNFASTVTVTDAAYYKGRLAALGGSS